MILEIGLETTISAIPEKAELIEVEINLAMAMSVTAVEVSALTDWLNGLKTRKSGIESEIDVLIVDVVGRNTRNRDVPFVDIAELTVAVKFQI